MFMLIKNGHIVSDGWKTLVLADKDTPQNVRLPVGPVLVPLPVWKARRSELIYREHEHGWPLGIWLAADEDADAIEHDIEDFTVIGIKFDKFSDGKSYETAQRLREHYGYRGELRAIGDVPRDRVSYQHQVGIDAFAIQRKRNVVVSGLFGLDVARKPYPQTAATAA